MFVLYIRRCFDCRDDLTKSGISNKETQQFQLDVYSLPDIELIKFITSFCQLFPSLKKLKLNMGMDGGVSFFVVECSLSTC